jgi:hypothetical protein
MGNMIIALPPRVRPNILLEISIRVCVREILAVKAFEIALVRLGVDDRDQILDCRNHHVLERGDKC